ncbi:MAG: hypothetical protein KA207_15010 [Burkholderiaceae bacterium]|jgi:hypothetical protein|nr:hypothetical protein [Betaproteobacteria bacterium]MBP6647168.1 hypothetical protein [Burkholderiaceae bacterium]
MTLSRVSGAAGEPTAVKAGAFSGLAVFQQHVRDVLALAVLQQWSVIVLSDPDFADWPLGEHAVVKCLNDWSRSGRSITLLASSYEFVQSHHARLIDWRRRWDHIVTCRKFGNRNAAGGTSTVPSVVWTPDWVVHRKVIETCAGQCTQSALRRAELRESLNNCLKQSSPGLAASVLGL